MRVSSRPMLILLSLFALLCYALMPSLGFVAEGIPLFLMSGYTAGVYFSPLFLIPLGMLTVSFFVTLFGKRPAIAVTVLLTFLTLILFTLFNVFARPLLSANADWLIRHATTLVKVMEGRGVSSKVEPMMRHAIGNGMAQIQIGYIIALAFCALQFILSAFGRPVLERGKARE